MRDLEERHYPRNNYKEIQKKPLSSIESTGENKTHAERREGREERGKPQFLLPFLLRVLLYSFHSTHAPKTFLGSLYGGERCKE